MIPGGPEVFNANIEALRARSPELAAVVAKAEPHPLEAVAARTGAPTARSGALWLHSRYDPVAEGRNAAAEAVSAGAELVLVLGLGLGYTAAAALASGSAVVAVETEAAWLAATMRIMDLSGILSDESFHLVLCPGGRGLRDFLDGISPRSIAVAENPSTMAAFPEAARLLKEQAAGYRMKDEINAATLKRFGRLWVRNLARNVGPAARLPGIVPFSGRFSGLPALVLAAGPSLDDVAAILPELARRLVVVCVDTALRTTLRAGVEPDFVIVVDPQYWNARHLDRCQSPGSVLVAEAAVWPAVLRFSSRLTALCSSIYPLGRYVEDRLGPPRGALGAGGSVATTAWDFARILGCAPVYMAGLDLSFPGGRTHARASLFEQRSLSDGTRLAPSATAAFQAMRGGRPFQAPSNDGGLVTSDERLSLYSTWFSRKAGAHPEAPTFNLSARGLSIPGLAPASQADLLALPDIRADVDGRLEAAVAEIGGADDSAEARARTVLDGLVLELERVAGMAESAVAVAIAAKGSSGAALERALAELTAIDELVLSSEARDVVGFLIASASEAVGGRARSVDDSLEHTARLYGLVADSARLHAVNLS